MYFDPKAGGPYGGKLRMGPIWDLDQAWGRENGNQNFEGAGPGFTKESMDFYFQDLLSTTEYRTRFKSRWNAVKGPLRSELHAYIDAQSARLGTLSSYSFPNNYFGNNINVNNYTALKNTITARIQLLDSKFATW
jgi:hypothetical protein